ncbi:MAG: ATP-binding protein [Variovorax sp.]
MHAVGPGNPRAEGANQFRIEHHRGVLLASDGSPVHISLGGRSVSERSANQRRPPQTPAGFLDRDEITGIIVSSLAAGVHAVELAGESGIGKSWLMRHAGAQAQPYFSDGVVRLPPGMRGGFDLLQALFDAFYSVDARCRPGRLELRERLAGKQVLLLADEAALDDRAVEQLRDVAPDCALLSSTREPTLRRASAPIVLHGLPTADAMTLIERARGAPLEGAAFGAALERCQAEGGHPERLGRTDESGMRAGSSTRLTSDARAVLDTLAAFHPQPVLSTVLAELSAVPRAHANARSLMDDGWCYEDEGWLRVAPHALGRLEATPEQGLRRRCDALVRLGRHVGRLSYPVDPSRLALPLLWFGLARAREADAWADVVAIGRCWDLPLTLMTLWDAAKRLLEWHAEAAWTLADLRERAWALHQHGTLELAQGYPPLAAQLLREAFALAQRDGDAALAASARHHLGWLTPEAPPGGWDNMPTGSLQD